MTMNEIRQDVAFSLRLLRRSPWSSAAAVVVLALGIGANSAIVGLLDAALLRPLPYPEAERLVQVEQDQRVEVSPEFSAEKFLAWRAGSSRSMEAMAAYDTPRRFALRNLIGQPLLAAGAGGRRPPPERHLVGQPRSAAALGAGRPQLVSGLRVTREIFAVLGVAPLAGRGFTADEDRPGGPAVAVPSQHLWQSLFAGDPAALGRRLDLDGTPYTIVGVMPAAFRLPAAADLWLPLQLDPASHEHAQELLVTARLRRGVHREPAEQELQAANRGYLAAQGWGASRERARLLPFDLFLRGSYRRPLLLALAAVGLVLLIACANVANLQLAKLTARRREIGIRASLGASAARILRQLLTESLVLALAGGGLGLALCAALLPALPALAPAGLALVPAGEMVRLDARVFCFALALALAAGVLAGLAPAWNAGARGLRSGLAEGAAGAGSAGGRRGGRLRRALVVVETALAMALLISAGLLIKSFAGLLATDPGFATEHVLTAKVALPPEAYRGPAALERFERELLPELAALPGVRMAALAGTLPCERGPAMTFIVAGRPVGPGGEGVGLAEYRGVTSGYFAALGIRLLRGRPFAAGDAASAPGVLILNAAAARQFFPGQRALGQRITIGLPDMPRQADPAAREVVGIAADVRERDLAQPPPPILYVPLAQVPPNLNALLLRAFPLSVVLATAVDPSSLAAAARQRLWEREPDLPVLDVVPLDAIVARSLGAPRFQALLVGGMGALALVLSALGIYGVLAHLVAQRSREIGIRMALGGHRRAIQLLVVRQGMAPALAGIGIGTLGALGATRLLAGFLTGLSTTDPAVFSAAPLLMAAIALLATALPARRAARVDPATALKAD
jgi:putative ABC transport system permease protein